MSQATDTEIGDVLFIAPNTSYNKFLSLNKQSSSPSRSRMQVGVVSM